MNANEAFVAACQASGDYRRDYVNLIHSIRKSIEEAVNSGQFGTQVKVPAELLHKPYLHSLRRYFESEGYRISAEAGINQSGHVHVSW